MRYLVLALLVVACSSPAARPPTPPPVVVAAPPIDAPTPPTAPEAEPVDAASAPEPLVNPAVEAGKRAEFHCFAWAHGPQFSTDCYRTAAICETEHKAMAEGARSPQPCERVAGASCTSVGGRQMKKEERCFGDANNCERYRAFVTGNGLDVTACIDR